MSGMLMSMMTMSGRVSSVASQRFAPRADRTDHLELLLEGEEFLDVFPCLLDVVNDQHLDDVFLLFILHSLYALIRVICLSCVLPDS